MKDVIQFTVLLVMVSPFLFAQDAANYMKQKEEIESLIGKYEQARDEKDTLLLKSILTAEIDQLVSTGEWRRGIEGAMHGMMRSSGNNPGDRTLLVDHIRFLNPKAAIVDTRYEIKNADGTIRRMWSTFFVVDEVGKWKITAIRNMLPTGNF